MTMASSVVFERDNQIFIGRIDTKILNGSNEVVEMLRGTPIRIPDCTFPRYSFALFGSTEVMIPEEEVFEKRPCLLEFDIDHGGDIGELMVREAQVYRVLDRYPKHPNIVKYHGCVVRNERVVGFTWRSVFTNYQIFQTRNGASRSMLMWL